MLSKGVELVRKTIYLDTNILSRIPDLKLSEESALAYEKLSQRDDIEFVTSAKTQQEINMTPNKSQASVLNFLYSLFRKTPMRVSEYSGVYGDAPFGCTTFGGGWTDPLFRQLKDIFEKDDAEHIFQATKSKCNYFLTLDKKSILNRVNSKLDKLNEICPNLVFTSPELILDELEN